VRKSGGRLDRGSRVPRPGFREDDGSGTLMPQPTFSMKGAVYELDIGIYYTGAHGQILSATTAAWCRAVSGIVSFDALRYSGTPCSGVFKISPGPAAAESSDFICGRSIPRLAESIARDLADGRWVALGFEAPMWIPLSFGEGPNLQLFSPRFPAEAEHAWYLQSGAAATVKSISLGVPLLELVRDRTRGTELRFTTTPEERKENTIVLFEAFVAGNYKIPDFSGAKDAPNEWDAFLAALAWGNLHADFAVPNDVESATLHRADSRPEPSVSIWETIAGTSPVCGPLDCEVVGLTRVQRFPAAQPGENSASDS
jgi:hypothetical protein